MTKILIVLNSLILDNSFDNDSLQFSSVVPEDSHQHSKILGNTQRVSETLVITEEDMLCTSQDFLFPNGTYGKDWIFFPNGDGKMEIAYLTATAGQNIKAEVLGNELNNKNQYMDVEFNLYTIKSQDIPKVYTNDKNTLRNLKNYFSNKLETKIIVHGWRSSGKSNVIQQIKDAYLKRGEYNVFGVNWENLASNYFYPLPAINTAYVGRAIALFVDHLIKVEGARAEDIHLIGHSLGAHTVGFAGSYTKNGRVGRITGLDPALPGFEYSFGPEARLDPTDGEFVDVIHTSAGIVGYEHPLGHADFYPNSGRSIQPGCDVVLGIIDACSHGRAYEYFMESITSQEGFISQACPSWDHFLKGKCENSSVVLMGERTNISVRGTYYLRTNSEFPFAMGTV